VFAFPALYVVMWLVSDTGFGRFVLRTFFGMWLHELGHASAAWLTGRWALPLPWFTFSFGQNIVVSVAMFGGAAALLRFGRQRESVTTMVLGGVLGLATVLGHLAPTSVQQPFFTFGGEAGAMVFGALVSCGFLVRSPLRLFQGGLRWGWLVIGTASWADATRVWWDSKTDFAAIPFGLEDGMPSDASRLVDEFGWDAQVMVRRFLLVALVSLVFAMVASGVALGVSTDLPGIVFGGSEKPLPATFDGSWMRALHAIAAKLLMALIVLHVAAALWHQFVRRDRLLRRMGFGINR
jgi:hypothetical protein